MNYQDFIQSKAQTTEKAGWDIGLDELHPDLFDFQKHIVQWAIGMGRCAVFADTGTGKTFMQLVWADLVTRKTNKPVLILAPLAVAFQTVLEGQKIGVEVNHREGIKKGDNIIITNYERLNRFNCNDFAGVVCDESSILKNFKGTTCADVIAFMRKIPYRLLCTATAAPNDYIELGTSSEAIGKLGYQDMISKFFKLVDNYQHGVNIRVSRLTLVFLIGEMGIRLTCRNLKPKST